MFLNLKDTEDQIDILSFFFFYNIQNVFLIFETAAENMIHDFQDINEQINK